MKILKQLEIETPARRVVLYDGMEAGRNNLLIECAKGEKIYPEPPVGPIQSDCFMEIEWDGTRLIAYSWTGYKMRIDLLTGALREVEFTH